MKELTFVCCLFKGTKGRVSKPKTYTPEWANKLYRGVARNMHHTPFRFACVTDMDDGTFDPNIEVYPLLYPDGTWLALTECMRPDIGEGHRVFMGLDTVIVGPLDDLCSYQGEWAWLHNPVDQRLHDSNALVMWSQSTGTRVWEEYISNREAWAKDERVLIRASVWPKTGVRVMTWNTRGDAPSEMLMWAEILKKLGIQPDYFDDSHPGAAILSRLVSQAPVAPPHARVIYFSGSITPASENLPLWLKDNWV